MWPWALWVLPLLCRRSLAGPPAPPEDISCIYYYEKNFTCTWSPEKEASDTQYQVKRTFIYGQQSDTCRSTGPSCSFCSSVTFPDIYTVQVEAWNVDGVVRSNVTQWNLDTIVQTEPPEISSVKPFLGVKRMLQVKWKRPTLAPFSSTLNYTLRFRPENSARWMEVTFTEKETREQQTYNLRGLQAFTNYVVALRCAADGSKFWSDWSQEERGTTEEEAPRGLDLWRVLRPTQADGRRSVKLLWKKARGSPVLEKALGYQIWYSPENSTNLTEMATVNSTQQEVECSLGDEAYWVSVVSYNSLGQSPVATLRIPAVREKAYSYIKYMRAFHEQDDLVVAWQSSASDVDMWMVEWLPDLDLEPATMSWERVSQARNWTIKQDKLKPFQCYNISVYPVWQDRVGMPWSVQIAARENRPSGGPATRAEGVGMHTATIAWERVSPAKRAGCVRSYTILCQAEDGRAFSRTVNSSIQRYSLESLERGTFYTVVVMANTSAGGTNGNSVNFKTSSISVLEICLITSLVGGGLLLLTVLTGAYASKKSSNLKYLCWPDVPDPAASSIATWPGDALKGQRSLKEADNPVNLEGDRILKPRSAPSDLIDKLVVNFQNFLGEVSTEASGTGPENTSGGEENEYVISPYRPYCPPGKRSVEAPTTTEMPRGKSQRLCSGRPAGTCPDPRVQLLSSAQGSGPACRGEEGAPNPYLKNSVTTREFLVSENLPDQTKQEF